MPIKRHNPNLVRKLSFTFHKRIIGKAAPMKSVTMENTVAGLSDLSKAKQIAHA